MIFDDGARRDQLRHLLGGGAEGPGQSVAGLGSALAACPCAERAPGQIGSVWLKGMPSLSEVGTVIQKFCADERRDLRYLPNESSPVRFGCAGLLNLRAVLLVENSALQNVCADILNACTDNVDYRLSIRQPRPLFWRGSAIL